MKTFFCLFSLLALALSASVTPIPNGLSAMRVGPELSIARSLSASCVIGKFFVIASGDIGPLFSTYSSSIDVIDMATETVHSATLVGTPRVYSGASRYGTDSCLIVGGRDYAGANSNSVDLIQIDTTTGTVLSVTSVAPFETPAGVALSHIGCTTDFSNNVWCIGGFDVNTSTYSNYAAYFNGTGWVQVADLPVASSFQDGGACVYFSDKIYCCGCTPILGACQVFDTLNTLSWANISIPQRIKAAVFLEKYPLEQIILWGGEGPTGVPDGSATFISSSGTVTSASLDTPFTSPAAAVMIAGSAFVWGAQTSDFQSTTTSPFLLGADFSSATPYEPSILWDPTTLASMATPGFSFGVGAAYNNHIFLCGGVAQAFPLYNPYCLVFEQPCLVGSPNGHTEFVNTPTFVGCQLNSCYAGHYGVKCSQSCNCNGQPCDDGFTGTGACFCEQNYYGSACEFFEPCSGNGVSENGTCTCFQGYSGAQCQDGPSPCLNNGVADLSTGLCYCQAGTYGTYCASVCDCGTNAICDDGATGTGACICAPGYYTIPNAPKNCTGTCRCGNGICNDGNYGDGTCECARGWFGHDCSENCNAPNSVSPNGCSPKLVSPTEILLFRCNDGSSGTGECVRLYSGSSSMIASSLFVLLVLCLSLF